MRKYNAVETQKIADAEANVEIKLENCKYEKVIFWSQKEKRFPKFSWAGFKNGFYHYPRQNPDPKHIKYEKFRMWKSLNAAKYNFLNGTFF